MAETADFERLVNDVAADFGVLCAVCKRPQQEHFAPDASHEYKPETAGEQGRWEEHIAALSEDEVRREYLVMCLRSETPGLILDLTTRLATETARAERMELERNGFERDALMFESSARRAVERAEQAERELDGTREQLLLTAGNNGKLRAETKAAEEENRKLRALVGGARKLAGKSWSRGMGFNGPPSPREWRAWMDECDAFMQREIDLNKVAPEPEALTPALADAAALEAKT